MDVTALYPSIPIKDGLHRVQQLLVHYHLKLDVFAKKVELIVKLLKLVLESNIALYDGVYYLQVIGTAMGTPVAPNFAILFMYSVEQQLVDCFFRSGKLLFYTRYIDDILAAFRDSSSAREFWTAFNKLHEAIHVSGSTAARSVDFLDLTIYHGSRFHSANQLDVRTFEKIQNSHLFLTFSSAHTPKSKEAFVVEAVARLIRTNSSFTNFVSLKKLLFLRLTQRGYPHYKLRRWMNKVKFSQREQLLQRKIKPSSGSAPMFISRYHPTLPKLFNLAQVLREHWPIHNFGFDRPPLLGYSLPRSLKAKVNAVGSQ